MHCAVGSTCGALDAQAAPGRPNFEVWGAARLVASARLGCQTQRFETFASRFRVQLSASRPMQDAMLTSRCSAKEVAWWPASSASFGVV
eukprot:255668-Chlamydomonas_euryale.AAC.5